MSNENEQTKKELREKKNENGYVWSRCFKRRHIKEVKRILKYRIWDKKTSQIRGKACLL